MSEESSGLDQNTDNLIKEAAEASLESEKIVSAEKAKAGKILGENNLADRDIDIEKVSIEAELQAAKSEAADNYDKYLRAIAELDNFKKRTLKERSELIKYQGERIFSDLLGIIDDVDRALQFKNSDPTALVSGFEMIHARFLELLSKWEVRGESQIGKQFDPMVHNALAKAPSEEHPEGVITNELKKPFFYKDKLLRPGEVVVSEGPGKKSE
jgi:molecular chaperone GrpE